MTRNTNRSLILASFALALTACSEAGPAASVAEGNPAVEAQSSAGLFNHRMGQFEKPATPPAAVYRNGIARGLVDLNASPPPFAIRGFALVGVAQYQAAIAALGGKGVLIIRRCARRSLPRRLPR